MENQEPIEAEIPQVTVQIQVHRDSNAVIIIPSLPEIKDELRYVHRQMEFGGPKLKPGETKKWVPPGKFNKYKAIKRETRDLFAETSDGQIVTHCGLLSGVKQLLTELEIPFTESFTGEWAIPVIHAGIAEGLRPEQVDAVSHLLSAGASGGGMVEAATGIGKTRIIAALIKSYPEKKIAVVTKSVSVIRGLHKNLNELLTGHIEEPVGICYGKEKAPRRITVCTLGTVDYLDPETVDVLIVDECHTTAGDAMAAQIMMFTKAIRFGLSGTISNRWDGKDKLLQALYGPIVFSVADEEAERLGRVCPLEVYFLQVNDGPTLYHGMTDVSRERNGIWKNQHRNALIKDVCDRAPEDQQIIIFVKTVQHLQQLQKLLPGASVCHGDLNLSDRTDIEEKFVSGEVKRLISTNCLSTGIDPKQLMIVIDASAEKGDSSMPQKRGRLRRWADGKTHGVLVNFSDNWDQGFARKALNRIKDYQERGDNVHINVNPSDIRFVEINKIEQEEIQVDNQEDPQV